MTDTDRLAALLADAARPLSVSEDGMVGIPSLTEMAARLIAAGVTLQPAAPAEGLDVGAMQAALVAVIESNALDSDDLLWLDKMCRKAIGTDWPYLAAPAEGLLIAAAEWCKANGYISTANVLYAIEEAQPTAPAEGLDVERWMAARHHVLHPQHDVGAEGCLCLDEQETVIAIAREYAAIKEASE